MDKTYIVTDDCMNIVIPYAPEDRIRIILARGIVVGSRSVDDVPICISNEEKLEIN